MALSEQDKADEVSLWISNDERLYKLAIECLKTSSSVRTATNRFFRHTGRMYVPDTRIKFTWARVYAALEDLSG